MEIPKEAFHAIHLELLRQPLAVNKFRNDAGVGRSQTFGVTTRRSGPPEYSRNCWNRPYLYKLLLDFGEQYVDIPYNAIVINQNYQAGKHRDKNNLGTSFLVAFGDYTGGELMIHEGDLSGSHDICRKPVITDFSQVLHSVNPFTGERFSLVYYYYEDQRWIVNLPKPSVQKVDEKWCFFRGDMKVTKQTGLPHVLKGRKKNPIKQTEGDYLISFS